MLFCPNLVDARALPPHVGGQSVGPPEQGLVGEIGEAAHVERRGEHQVAAAVRQEAVHAEPTRPVKAEARARPPRTPVGLLEEGGEKSRGTQRGAKVQGSGVRGSFKQ